MIFLVIIHTLLTIFNTPTTDINKIDVVRNDIHVISYQCLTEEILFTFDLIGDRSNNINGQWPKLDHYRIWVDFNNNGRVDSLTDKVFGPKHLKNESLVCKSLVYTKARLTTCNFNSTSECTNNFTSSDNSQINHVIFEMKIPKEELSNSNIFNVYFEIIDGEGKNYEYPISSILFHRTFKLSCEKIST